MKIQLQSEELLEAAKAMGWFYDGAAWQDPFRPARRVLDVTVDDVASDAPAWLRANGEDVYVTRGTLCDETKAGLVRLVLAAMARKTGSAPSAEVRDES